MPASDTEIKELSSEIDDQHETVPKDPKPAADESKVTEKVARPGRRVSLSVRGLLVALVMGLLAATAAVFGWLYLDANDRLAAEALQAGNYQRAEDIAAKYAVSAAEMNYQDFGAWKANLVAGTAPDLKDKLLQASGSMEQVLAPLQWQSTAKPLATKVRSDVGGVYTVDSFVSVLTKTMQAPEGLQSTATYSVTVDSNADWQITDVGGIDAALGK
ncbi:hypothetical protein A5742_14755 [Mycolicibacterium fortuitum]|uniref:Mce-associated membrane protein n=1 Tax=Mycolicibacterium fortuitum TaxID=1766 RepID=A0ABD6QD82_MYCFO|nr:hypothetical protein [Mycolicibacterium fortuitum]OMC33147.1 hypothetical protein A5742_14755 [Mycolicibacterium fortuitum]